MAYEMDRRAYHRHPSGFTTAPRTGPIVTPRTRLKTYTVTGPTRSWLVRNTLAATPSAAFCSVPPAAPPMARQTITVVKFCASAWGTKKMVKIVYAVYSVRSSL